MLRPLRAHTDYVEFVNEQLGSISISKAHKDVTSKLVLLDLTPVRLLMLNLYRMAIEQWGVEHQALLSELVGLPIRRTDFTDDRLSHVLTHLADDAAWSPIEQILWHNTRYTTRISFAACCFNHPIDQ